MYSRFSFPFLLLLFSIGSYLVSYLPYLPNLLGLGVLCLGVALSGLLCHLWGRFYCFWCLCAFALGVCYGSFYAYQLVSGQWPKALDNQAFIVEGRVLDLPQKREHSQRFNFIIEQLVGLDTDLLPEQTAQLINKKITLSWRLNASTEQYISSGDKWRLSVKLRRPRGFVNPSGFDYQLYLLQQGLMATGYVRDSHHNQFIANHCSWINTGCWRQKIASNLTGNKNQGLMAGLLVGDRQSISVEQWDILKQTGTIHLLAISGLHIGLAATIGMLAGALVSRFLQLIWLSQWLSKITMPCLAPYYIPSLFSVGFAFFYSLLAGLSLPTQRALIMVLVFHLGLLCARKISPWIIFSIALFVMSLLDPLSVRTSGFWLSFGAVAVLLFSFIGYQSRSNKQNDDIFEQRSVIERGYKAGLFLPLFSLFKSQYVIFFGLLVPSIFLVQGVSIVAPLANLVAIPLVSFITVPLLLFSLLFSFIPLPFVASFVAPLLKFLTQAAAISLDCLMAYLHWLTHVGGYWQFDLRYFSPLTLSLTLLGVLCLLLPSGLFMTRRSQYAVGVSLCLALFFYKAPAPVFKMTFMDVGQGTGIVVQTPQHQLVYDTGKHYSERFDSGQHLIAPYLLSEGHKRIDALVISHADSDHAGGSAGLQSQISVDDVLSGQPHETGGRQCLAGQHWQWEHLHIRVLWPDKDFIAAAGAKVKNNDYSCVLLLSIADKRILLTGDIEKQTEVALLARYADLLQNIDVVLVPHHGSGGSSHNAWVDALKPQYAVITAGYHNAYGHPHPRVVERYRAVGSQIRHTGHLGAVEISIADINDAMNVISWRESEHRYWYD